MARTPRLLVLLAALVAGVLPGVGPASAASCADVFPASFAAALARDFPQQRVTASVYDTRTHCWYDLHPDLRLTTASVIKAGMMASVLLRAQDAGRGLSDAERARIRPVIQLSHDAPEASELYGMAGGVAGMDRADRRFGLTATHNTASYGATTTSARDRTLLSLRLLHSGGPLSAASRGQAWRYMSTVHPTQRWGISAGVPAGWAVALKNGFYPMRGNGWRVGSTGFVRQHGGGGYAVTVLSDRNGSQVEGMRLVETVARRVAVVLAGSPAGPRSVDRAVCTTTSSGQTWAQVAARVGGTAAEVRNVSGGGRAPLQGQRTCSPTLRS